MSSQKRILITGAAGFIGSHLTEHILRFTDWEIIILDRLDVSGNLHRLTDMECWEANKHRVRFVFHDLKAPIRGQVADRIGPVDHILHLAASTHVDRSIDDPMMFVEDNVVGTTNLLIFARVYLKTSGGGQFLYFSTDEVFGPAPVEMAYPEWARYNSGNPYAAAKAGGEEMALAFANTYRLPVIITHTMNVFGERQHPEKFIPMCINKVLANETITIHSNKEKTKAGSRFYIHARNVAGAVMFLLERYSMPDPVNVLPHGTYWRPEHADKFNIVGEKEVDNLEMAQMICDFVGEIRNERGEGHNPLKYEMVDFHSSRPGHDLRYALDGKKMQEMGWSVPLTFEQSLKNTVRWYLEHPEWLKS